MRIDHLIVLRDGVSEGEYEQVQHEIDGIKGTEITSVIYLLS